ncbi:hypothetical protein HYU07_07220 [Candidatus Woesearchaeota archaeon]|nr:hypothetical protein [Candidatus Woesearchaeota archaeon]
MSIDDDVKAPKDKFSVCLWDCYPRMDPPIEIVETFDNEESAVKYTSGKNNELRKEYYEKKKGTENYYRKMGNLVPAEILVSVDRASRMIEPEYFVINDRGIRVY